MWKLLPQQQQILQILKKDLWQISITQFSEGTDSEKGFGQISSVVLLTSNMEAVCLHFTGNFWFCAYVLILCVFGEGRTLWTWTSCRTLVAHFELNILKVNFSCVLRFVLSLHRILDIHLKGAEHQVLHHVVKWIVTCSLPAPVWFVFSHLNCSSGSKVAGWGSQSW